MKLPVYDEGRFIDPRIGVLAGEGAHQRAPANVMRAPSREEEVPGAPPIVKGPVWGWYVPAYFHVGGVTGASLVLAAASQLRGGAPGLVRRARWIGAGGALASAALLIADLGVPARFLNMLRVFRPTSPMNLGAWNLALLGGAAGAAAGLQHVRPLRGVADAAGLAAGGLGLSLAGYTGVLVATSAVPVWQEMRRSLPPLFIASATASAAALLELLPATEVERRTARRFGVAGRVAELLLEQVAQREAGRVKRVAEPLSSGRSGALWRAAAVCTAASLGLTLAGRHRAAAALATAGALALRFGVVEAGRASARDPRATIDLQRAPGAIPAPARDRAGGLPAAQPGAGP